MTANNGVDCACPPGTTFNSVSEVCETNDLCSIDGPNGVLEAGEECDGGDGCDGYCKCTAPLFS